MENRGGMFSLGISPMTLREKLLDNFRKAVEECGGPEKFMAEFPSIRAFSDYCDERIRRGSLRRLSIPEAAYTSGQAHAIVYDPSFAKACAGILGLY